MASFQVLGGDGWRGSVLSAGFTLGDSLAAEPESLR